ncbi:uncharacterized protein AMSG_10831 [Thecamonas trahens ATCC 50062]|uniref:Uncharacterized protein n=1 Tax=Thecamonas trahens ATCC 50062 TaxID=461836 RepID=A0A0L0DS93_THETB|nr:hypothetical protein AMSG_10831 [Thecamonas trahens ATCC 50062]KNC55209.1 hypothetical protein AMSG_10831 [Thecamonas trahens ATCC 50062]|eukprot:XP_013753142.1 hypothetical protein AMSG_10831 [Thecamonas trahens ATCC 50062]
MSLMARGETVARKDVEVLNTAAARYHFLLWWRGLSAAPAAGIGAIGLVTSANYANSEAASQRRAEATAGCCHIHGMEDSAAWRRYVCCYLFGCAIPLSPPEKHCHLDSLSDDEISASSDDTTRSSDDDATTYTWIDSFDSDSGSGSGSGSSSGSPSSQSPSLRDRSSWSADGGAMSSIEVLMVDDAALELKTVERWIKAARRPLVLGRGLYYRARLMLRKARKVAASCSRLRGASLNEWSSLMGAALGDAESANTLGFVPAEFVRARVYAELGMVAEALVAAQVLEHWLPTASYTALDEASSLAYSSSSVLASDSPRSGSAPPVIDTRPRGDKSDDDTRVASGLATLATDSPVAFILRVHIRFLRAVVFFRMGDVAASMTVLAALALFIRSCSFFLRSPQLTAFAKASLRNIHATRSYLKQHRPLRPKKRHLFTSRSRSRSSSSSSSSSSSLSSDWSINWS